MKKLQKACGIVLLLSIVILLACACGKSASPTNSASTTSSQATGSDSMHPQNLTDLKRLYAKATSVVDKLNLVYEADNLASYEQLTETQRHEIINWLEDLSRSSTDRVVRQSALCVLYEYNNSNQSKDVMFRLVRDIDAQGVAWTKNNSADGWPQIWPTISWQMLQQIYEQYPDSYLARGIAAYEKVRGASYFGIERDKLSPGGAWWWQSYGDQQYDPDQEILGWESFLHEFANHPAADDAAYRLARCYEIKGRWKDALHTLLQAMSLPDGDMTYNIAGRLTYILDVRMSTSQLEELLKENPEPALRQMADYTLAVKNMRNGNYRQAATQLTGFLADLRSGVVPANLTPFMLAKVYNTDEYDFTGGIEKQLEQAKTLADLKDTWQHSKNPADLYQLAAAIFHDQTIYYNNLWTGERQNFIWLGNILTYNDNGDYWDPTGPPEMAGFEREMINYCHSGTLFEQVYQNPDASQDLKAKALFSLGLSQMGIDKWGQDAFVAFKSNALQDEIMNTFGKFVTEFPHSSMADDALLVLAETSGQRSYLDKIFTAYPNSDSVHRAKVLLYGTAPFVDIQVNGKRVFVYVPSIPAPFIDDNHRVQAPLRGIGEALGCKTDWNETTQQVTCANEQFKVIMKIGKKQLTVNGVPKTMDTAPVIMNGAPFVPVRALSEALNMNIHVAGWNGQTIYLRQ